MFKKYHDKKSQALAKKALELASYHEFGCNPDFPEKWCIKPEICDRCVLAGRIIKFAKMVVNGEI